MEDLQELLESTTLQDLIELEGHLVEVLSSASVAETLQIMYESSISAVAVLGSPEANGDDLRAQSSEIAASGQACQAACKQEEGCCSASPSGAALGLHEAETTAAGRYAGIASASDILHFLAELQSKTTEDGVAATLFFESPIHLCIRPRSLCILSPQTSVLEAMDEMLNGLQRALVPHIDCLEGQGCDDGDQRQGCRGYSMIAQTDIIRFFGTELQKLRPILGQSVEALQAYQRHVLGVWKDIPVADAIRCMHEASLFMVPILDVEESMTSVELTPAIGCMIEGAFSATDLKIFNVEAMSKWAQEGLLIFLKRLLIMDKSQFSVEALDCDVDAKYSLDLIGSFTRLELVSCSLSTSMEDVICMALLNNVQRVWVLEKDFVVKGAISFMDIFRVVRKCVEENQKCALSHSPNLGAIGTQVTLEIESLLQK